MRRLQLSKQQGATMLIVLMVMALATLIAAQLIEHGVFSKRRTDLMLGRDQGHQIALGGEALAKTWLAKGFGKDSEKVHLNQPWATTPFEYPVAGGMIRGTVKDALTCFNLNSLDPAAQETNDSGQGNDRNGRRDDDNGPGLNQRQDKDQEIFEQLLTEALMQADLSDVQPKTLVAPVVDWIDDDIQPTGIDGAEDLEYTGYEIPYRAANSLMASKSELRIVKGFSSKIYAAVKDYVCAIPDNSVNQINVNTLPAEKAVLLAAVAPGLSLSKAQQILGSRPEEGYDSATFQQQLSQDSRADVKRVVFKSDWFLLTINVELEGASFHMKSLVKRGDDKSGGGFSVVARYFGEF